MKISREELVKKLTDEITASVDMEVLIAHFWEDHYNFYWNEADDEKLYDDAVWTGIIEEGEDLEIED